MTKEELDWLYRLRSEIYVYMPKEWLIPMNNALDMAIQAIEQEPYEDWYDVPSNEMNLEQARRAVRDLRKKLVEHLKQEPCEDAICRDFQIGDEVRIIGSDPIYDDCDVGWVIRNASERVKTMYVMRNDGSAGEEIKAEWYKTGRHNDMLAEVINALPSVKPQERR